MHQDGDIKDFIDFVTSSWYASQVEDKNAHSLKFTLQVMVYNASQATRSSALFSTSLSTNNRWMKKVVDIGAQPSGMKVS